MSGATKRRGAQGTIIAWLAISFLVLTASGCARPDWIQQTLVTVDVSGAWQGTMTRPASSYGPGIIELMLEQRCSKVTGNLGLRPGSSVSGPIEGTISGDVFRFRDARGNLTGELQVNGDEMTGSGMWQGPVTLTLRRQ